MNGIFRSYADGRLLLIGVSSLPVPGLNGDTANFFDGLQSHNSTVIFRANTQKNHCALLAYYGGELKTLLHTGQQTAWGKINDLYYGMPYGQQAIVTAQVLSEPSSSDEDRPG